MGPLTLLISRNCTGLALPSFWIVETALDWPSCPSDCSGFLVLFSFFRCVLFIYYSLLVFLTVFSVPVFCFLTAFTFSVFFTLPAVFSVASLFIVFKTVFILSCFLSVFLTLFWVFYFFPISKTFLFSVLVSFSVCVYLALCSFFCHIFITELRPVFELFVNLFSCIFSDCVFCFLPFSRLSVFFRSLTLSWLCFVLRPFYYQIFTLNFALYSPFAVFRSLLRLSSVFLVLFTFFLFSVFSYIFPSFGFSGSLPIPWLYTVLPVLSFCPHLSSVFSAQI